VCIMIVNCTEIACFSYTEPLPEIAKNYRVPK
jgi:hypothetical protein